jgi:phospholipid-binding lipoprotein MlaA
MNRRIKKTQLGMLFLVLGLASNAYPVTQLNPVDPYEPFNRVMYKFNDILDRAILKPIATVYSKIIPKPITKGISNMYTNIDTLPTVANDLLQFNFYQATSDAWRLVINTTIGILGFFDVATEIGLDPNKEDFGLTLAQWGYKKSNYLILPFFGPSTPRDAIGLPVDYYIFSIYPHIHPPLTRYEIYGLGVVSRRADLLSFQSVLQQAAVDKYVFMRDAYMQRRAYLIKRNTELGNPYLEKNHNISDESANEDMTGIDVTDEEVKIDEEVKLE